MRPIVELVHFRGCPHVEAARVVLRAALGRMGLSLDWTEWDQGNPETPARVQGYGSPTVLVDGRDVRGGDASSLGRSCRIDGLPSIEAVQQALTETSTP